MINKSLMAKGLLIKYTPNRIHTPCDEDILLIVSEILNPDNCDCGFDQVYEDGSMKYYGHNQLHTFDRFNKVNTIRKDINQL